MTHAQPSVSVVIPARNAARTLPRALDSIERQTYSNLIEIVVACADDESAAAARRPGVTVVDNPARTTPAGLNAAVRATIGEVIVRCDAHSVLPDPYVAMAVETMFNTGAANVGGMQIPVGTTYWERSIASAMTSPLGAGNARYRLGGEPGPVETVYLGVFRRAALLDVGSFDESFIRTQDYELNHRLIEAGHVVWFDPRLKVEYTPRSSLRALWHQYYDYGRAKRAMARKHPGSLRARQLAPPALILALGLSLVASLFSTRSLVVPFTYLATTFAGGAKSSGPTWGTTIALLNMHVAWGLGFLIGRPRDAKR